ncbi:MAG: hypothetical protein EOP49_35705 [Sphingobacteriales bacterium]|nr:MAG: hypothetical protein EOP49_35705 [Sphingobacteriales bacterium]
MTQLLKIEWLKLKHYRTFWVMVLLFSVLLTALYVFVGMGVLNIGAGGMSVIGQVSSFSSLWNDLCFYASHFVIALAILMAIITTNEFQYKTHRQSVIDGWTRMQFYHAHWIILLAISLVTTVFVFLLGLLCGIISGLSLSDCLDNGQKLIWLFLLTVNYLGFAMTLSFFFKRSGLTIALLMFYSMIIEFFLNLIFLFKLKSPAADMFLPLQASDDLLPLDITKMLKNIAGITYIPEPGAYALATLGWIGLYYILGRIKLAKSDW